MRDLLFLSNDAYELKHSFQLEVIPYDAIPPYEEVAVAGSV